MFDEDNNSIAQAVWDSIAENLSKVGAISLDDYLNTTQPRHPAPSAAPEPAGVNPITRLHEACQRVFQNADALKFEFIQQTNSTNLKQCILTIVKPDGTRRSYATQPNFSKKNEAKLEAAKIAISMGALDFIAGTADSNLLRPSPQTSRTADHAASDSDSVQSETCVNDIEKCCLEWRAGRVIPHWVPFFDTKLTHKQGCALRIQLSPHVLRVYLSEPTFYTHLDAKNACAKIAVSEGVLDFIKYGNGQTCPSSPILSSPSIPQSPPPAAITPWTLQSFYDSLPRPLPESFSTNDASSINAPGWLNTMVQNARGGKLSLSFFFTSDGPPGLHGCLLRIARPDQYKAFLVNARFPKRSDAKSAVCLQAMSEGIGDYIRSIMSSLDAKITQAMRSFSSSVVYPALTSELGKIDTALVPLFEYEKESDAFSATLIVRLSTEPEPGQIKRYSVSSDYRNKADAKVAVICHAAEQGAVEFVRFRGAAPPEDYQSPYVLHTYDSSASRKRKQPGSADDGEQVRPAKKRVRTKRTKRREKRQQSCSDDRTSEAAIQPKGERTPDTSEPGEMRDPAPVGMRYDAQMHMPAYPVVLDPRFARVGGQGEHGYAVPGAYVSVPPVVDVPPLASGSSLAMPGSSSRVHRRTKDAELEPGEVVSSDESESVFSESSSRNKESDEGANELEIHSRENKAWKRNGNGNSIVKVEDVAIVGKNKGKGKETSPTTTSTVATSHVEKLIDFCTKHGRGMPLFHETQGQGRFEVCIVIGKERFDLPTTYASAEEGRQRVAKQVLARLCMGSSG